MREHISTAEQRTRQAFKSLNRFMILMWRLGLGVWLKSKDTWGQIMVIGHRGRKTGLVRRTPVNYAVVDGDLYCAAAYGASCDWYRNILAHPEVEVWHPDGRWRGIGEDVSDSDDRIQLLRQILVASGFAARLAGLNPHTISDEKLALVSERYRLLRIRRTDAMTGPGGPGDLAWIWPVVSLVLLGMLFSRRRKR